MKIVITIILFLFLLLRRYNELFINYLAIDNDKRDFYMRYIDYVLTGRKPNYFIYKNHLINDTLNPEIINNNYKYFKGHVWMNPHNRIIIPI